MAFVKEPSLESGHYESLDYWPEFSPRPPALLPPNLKHHVRIIQGSTSTTSCLNQETASQKQLYFKGLSSNTMFLHFVLRSANNLDFCVYSKTSSNVIGKG